MPYLMGCLSADGAFWRLGSDNGAERYNGAGRWAREANLPLAEMSVASMTCAWGVDTSGNAVQLTPGVVTRIDAPPAREVAVSRDDDLWILNWGDNNEPYHRKPDGSWEHVPSVVYGCWKITCGAPGDVWLLAENWWAGSPWQLTGGAWLQRGDQSAQAIAVGQDGQAWTNVGGEGPIEILRRTPSGTWSDVPSPVDYSIACIVGSEDWVAGGDAYRRSGVDWTLVPAPPGVQFDGIAAAADGTVIAWQGEWSNPGASFRFNGTVGWEPLPMSPEQGFFNAAARDAHGFYFALWSDHQLMFWPGTQWTDAGRRVKKVAACTDGTVWAIDAAGTASRRAADGTWQAFTDQLTAIGAGSHDVAWGLDSAGTVLQWNGSAFVGVFVDQQQPFTDISVGADGTLCAIGADKSLLFYTNTTWIPVQPGQAFLRVQVASAESITAVTAIDLDTGTNAVWSGSAPIVGPQAEYDAAPARSEAPRRRRSEPTDPKLRACMAQNAGQSAGQSAG